MRRLIQGIAFVATAALLPASAYGQRLGGGGSLDIPIGRILAAFLLCLAAAVLAILYMRQRGGLLRTAGFRALMGSTARARRVEIASSARAGMHADVSLIRCDGREYLVLTSPGAHTILDSRDIVPSHATVTA